MKVTKENFEAEVLKSDKKVVVDFYADWCGPCKMLSPILEKIGEERPDIKICKVNVDECSELAAAYGVSSIPMLMLIESGKTLSTTVGYRPEKELLAFIDQT